VRANLVRAVLGACLLSVLGAAGATAATPRVRLGSAPVLPHRATVTGSLPDSSSVHLTIGLTPRDSAGLQRFVAAVSDPGSPLFRRYLSVAEFARRFGAAPGRVAAVRRTLQADGLDVGTPTANNLTIPVSGSAAAVARTFDTSLSRVHLAGGRTTFANTTAPAPPVSIAGDVQAVVGLDDLHAPQPAVRTRDRRPSVVTGGPQPCTAATAVTARDVSYTADTVAAAYNFSSLYAAGDAGAGQTIGVYELQPVAAGDIDAYQGCYGTSTPVSYVNVDNPPAYTSGSDDTEAALDIEQAIGLAPAAHVIVYDAPDDGYGGLELYSAIMAANQAKVVSVSWGACEQFALSGGAGAVKEESDLFAEAAAQGQSIIAATGDNGSASCTAQEDGNGLAVQDPSSQPNVTAVGASSLYTTNSKGGVASWAPGDTLDEGVWNDGIDPSSGQPLGSTGGLSSLWAMPSYQSSAVAGLGVAKPLSGPTPCGYAICREVPDVSADGDPGTGYVVYVNGSWNVIGGTSAAAPVWAALTALANALPACRGLTIGFANPSLYELAGADYAGYFRDITTGTGSGPANNDALGTNGGFYPVTAGYDMATGLGVPNAAAVAAGLCALRAPVYTVTVANPGHRTAYLRTKFDLPVRGQDSGRVALSYSATGLPPGFAITALTGAISGEATKTGTYHVTVTAHDSDANLGQAAFTLRVIKPPPRFSAVRITGVAELRPRLSFTVEEGRFSPALRSITVTLPAGLRFGASGRGVRLREPRRRARFSARRVRRSLTVRFETLQKRVVMTVGAPTLSATGTLARRARRGDPGTVAIGLTATDGRRTTSRLSVRLRLRR
jgi:subtilase family serine protease